MTGEGFEQDIHMPANWEAVAAGVQLVANSEHFAQPTSFQSMSLTDTLGHVDRLAQEHPDNRNLQMEASNHLVRFGIRTNNHALLLQAMGSMDAFGQYNALYDVSAASIDKQSGLRLSPSIWNRLLSQVDRTASAEGGEPDYEPVDIRYTILAQELLDFAVEMHRDLHSSEKRGFAEDFRDLLIASIGIISGEDEGRIDQQYGRLEVIQRLLARFDRVCGEAGLWGVMAHSNTPEYFIYKAKAGNLTDEEQAMFASQLNGRNPVNALNASVVLSVQGDTAAQEMFRQILRSSEYGLPSLQTQPTMDAFRWASPELWRYSVGLPDPSPTSPDQLDELIAVGDPSFGQPIRASYADACFEAIVEGDATKQQLIFAMSLHMLRAPFIAPGPVDIEMFKEYVQAGISVGEMLLAVPSGRDEGLEAASAPPNPVEVMSAVEQWSNTVLPHVDPLFELRTQMDVLSLALLSEHISYETLFQLKTNTEIQATQMSARRSLEPLIEGEEERVGVLLHQTDNRLAELEKTRKITVVTKAGTLRFGATVEIGRNKDMKEPYL